MKGSVRPAPARQSRIRMGRWIGSRLLTLGLFGLVASFALAGWATRGAAKELQRRLTVEQSLRARATAARVDDLLSLDVQRLEALAARAGAVPADDAALKAQLRQFQLQAHERFDEVFLFGEDGAVVAEGSPGRAHPYGAWLVELAKAARRPTFSGVVRSATGAPRAYAVVPVRRGGRGPVVGALAAGMDLTGSALTRLMAVPGANGAGSVELLDGEGLVVASVGPDAHAPGLVAPLVAEQERFVTAPSALSSWTVVARQSRTSAQAFEAAMMGKAAAAGGVLLLVLLGFAYGASRSVTVPVGQLTDAAERLALGKLEDPIPELPRDEVGRLGAALERMRVALKESLASVERWNVELEQRVEDRTREMQRLNKELKTRAASRAEALRKVISAQEDERRRIARELHDETSQSLAALAIRLETLAKSTTDPEVQERVKDASGLAVKTLEEVHRLCMFLRPSVLDDLGLASAIQWYADHALGDRGISFRCEFSGLEERLAPEIETSVFRCAQEALTNVARHAEAETVLVQCAVRDGKLTLEVEDDGKGFDVASVDVPDAHGRGLGLLGIRERASLLGGEVTVSSSPGEGTDVRVVIPLEEAAAAQMATAAAAARAAANGRGNGNGSAGTGGSASAGGSASGGEVRHG